MSKKRPSEGDVDDLAETRRKARRINYYLDLVPARYYLGTETAQAKGGRWAHLDPKLVKSTTQLIAEAATAEDQPATSSKKKKSKDKRGRSLSQSPEPSGPNSRTELREKLNRRIAELREERRRKQSEADKAKAAEIRAAREKAASATPNGVKSSHKTEARRGAAEDEEEEPEVGRVSFDAEAANLPFEASVGHRGRKVKKLQAELRKQEADAAKLRNAERRGEGEELRKELAYEKALQRARGEKVHDDVSKLRKVQKTMEMKKKKGQDRWNAKVESDKQKAEEQQAQRKANLQNRGTKKKAQQQRRMGFEGKRTSFLNSE